MAAVAPLDAGATTTPDGPTSDDSQLLFSLQVFLDRLTLTPSISGAPAGGTTVPTSTTTPDTCKAFLVGFQLLQYEIVLFDQHKTQTRVSGHEGHVGHSGEVGSDGSTATSGEPVTLVIEHGKSCLFDAEPSTLAQQLVRDRDAPLVLLLMTQDRDRARLEAFASIPLPLHVGIEADGSVASEMKYRVCEWARSAAKWELRNHRNQVVGHAVGVVTLSCLGKTLAPHLSAALGVRVEQATNEVIADATETNDKNSSSAAEGGIEVKEATGNDEAVTAHSGTSAISPPEGASNSPPVEKAMLDASVQCDQEMERWVSGTIPDSSDGDRGGGVGSSVVIKGTNRTRDGGTASTLENARTLREQHKVHSFHSDRSCPDANECWIPRRKLPPPLFFRSKPGKK